jgi:hypothetical protein
MDHYPLNVQREIFQATTEHHVLKAYWGSENIAPRILDLGTNWR